MSVTDLLKSQPQRALHYAWIARTRHAAKAFADLRTGRVKLRRSVDRIELRVVEEVVNLPTELQLRFPHEEGKVLEYGHIPVVHVRQATADFRRIASVVAVIATAHWSIARQPHRRGDISPVAPDDRAGMSQARRKPYFSAKTALG